MTMEKTKASNTIRNEKGDITTVHTETQTIIRNCYEQS